MINHKARQGGTTEREEERDDYLVYTNKDIWGVGTKLHAFLISG